jgi:hypothetical protein
MGFLKPISELRRETAALDGSNRLDRHSDRRRGPVMTGIAIPNEVTTVGETTVKTVTVVSIEVRAQTPT